MTSEFADNPPAVEAEHWDSERTVPVAVERRQVVRGIAIAGAAGFGYASLSACAGGSGSGGSSPGEGKMIAPAADIPLGGGKVFEQQKVVVTQPRRGEFKAFSALCTHQGCTVDRVEDDLIQCPCHGSEYSIVDASVRTGPATEPLDSYQVKIQDGQIVVR